MRPCHGKFHGVTDLTLHALLYTATTRFAFPGKRRRKGRNSSYRAAPSELMTASNRSGQ